MALINQKHILAIDLGTSGAKVALYDTQGELIDYEFEETKLYLLPGGGVEQDPEDWWSAIKSAAQRLLAKSLIPSRAITALCCTTQWAGTVAVDESGKHLMNAIIWMDSRGAAYNQRVSGGPLSVEGYAPRKLITWVRLTGGVPGHAGKDPLGHILFIKNELPEIYAKTYKFLEPKDYLNMRLTGRFAASYESITLHWLTDNRDLSNVDYNERLLSMTALEREKFPNLKQAVDILGSIKPEVAEELGLQPNIQVIMGTPDIHSAAIGSGAVGDFEAHIYLGTSSWIACHTPFKKTDVFHSIASLPSAIPNKYLVTNEQQTSGACLNYLRDNVLYHQDELLTEAGEPDVYKVFDRIVAQTPAGSDRLIFTPWLNGERTPVEDRTIRAGLYNLSLSTTREHIIRAVFEGVAYNAKWLLGYVEKFVQRRLEVLTMIGGGANSDVWCQIFADVLDRPIRQVNDPILANARGTAFLASVALGQLSFDDVSGRVKISQNYTPNPNNRGIYDELFNEFLDIYKQNRPIFARLNK
jgi:xylulokinase